LKYLNKAEELAESLNLELELVAILLKYEEFGLLDEDKKNKLKDRTKKLKLKQYERILKKEEDIENYQKSINTIDIDYVRKNEDDDVTKQKKL